MKRKTFSTLILAGAFSLGLFASETNKPENHPPVDMPDNVKAIVESSCIGCHNTDSKNDKAKDKLDFKTIESLSKIKMISAYKDIQETIEKNEMPPKKFLEKYPDRALSEDQKKMLIEWAKKEAESLVKGN